VSTRRRDLAAALCRRELNLTFALALAATVACAFLAADSAAALRASGAMAPLAGRLLMRFDLTVLVGAGVLAVLRTAQRVADDHSAGWLDAYRGCGGDARAYGPAVVCAMTASGALLFAAAAIAFAVGVFVHDGVSDLLRGLPLLLPGGVLLLALHASFAAVISLLLRETVASLLAYATLGFGPTLLVTIHLIRAPADSQAGMPVRLVALLALPVGVPATAHQAAIAVVQLSIFAVVVAWVAGRLAGRRP
jgi:hypothetical protein